MSYTPTTWATGDVVTATKLNNIESGVSANTTNIAILATKADSIDANVASDFSSATAYAAGDYVIYNDQLYVFTAAHAAGAWTGADATATTVTDEITGNAEDLVTLRSDLSEITSDIDDISEHITGDNLLNTNDEYYLTNSFLASTTGVISTNASYITTGYIVVPNGYKAVVYGTDSSDTRTYSNRIRSYCAYDTIGGSYRSDLAPSSGSASYSEVVNSSGSDLYYRFSVKTSDYSDLVLIVVESSFSDATSEYMTSYVAYTDSNMVKTSALQCISSVDTVNLLDSTTWEDGYISAGNGTLGSNSSYTTTDYIEIECNKYLISSLDSARVEIFTIAFYDENYNVMYTGSASGDGTQGTTGYVYIPTGVKYCRITYAVSNYSSDIIVFQSSVIGYDASRSVLDDEYNATVYESVASYDLVNSPLYGKTVSWFGDSIIHNQWWVRCSTAFNMTSTDNGIGGTKISGTDATSMCQTSRIDGTYSDSGVAVPTDADIIIIGAGTNDWAQSVSLGEKEIQYDEDYNIETDATTFYQACHLMFRNFATYRPDARIIVLGTPFGFYTNRFTNTYGILNNQNLSSLDYGNALCDVAEMWGHIALRYGNSMGINDTNAADLLDPSEENGHLHPTTRKAKQMFFNATMNGLLSIKHLFAY